MGSKDWDPCLVCENDSECPRHTVTLQTSNAFSGILLGFCLSLVFWLVIIGAVTFVRYVL